MNPAHHSVSGRAVLSAPAFRATTPVGGLGEPDPARAAGQHLSTQEEATRNTLRRRQPRLVRLVAMAGVAAVLTGCFSLKPQVDSTRYFHLVPVAPPTPEPARVATSGVVVGIGPVKLPGYLGRASLAIRSSDNEVRYDDLRQWTEPLDGGIPRVLAANLEALLTAGHVRTPSWRRGEVTCELHLSVERFEVDEAGHGNLAAHWRITAPGAGGVLGQGRADLAREGPAPDAEPAGAVGTLSQLLGELAHQLAEALATLPHPPG